MADIAVIGGSRYFGRLLVAQLHDAGHQVTVINRGSTAPPKGVAHLVADRNDEAGLRAALGSRTFDAVVDQVCYTPVQAAVAARVFRGAAGRYVMTSTMEVYDPATADSVRAAVRPGEPVREEAVDPASWPVRRELPWGEDAFLAGHYAEGKRQAEAVFAQDGGLLYATVRSAHVLGGGAQEFTGRLDHYLQRILKGEKIAVHGELFPTVFIEHQEIAELLFWSASADFTGPVNACSHGALDVRALCKLIAEQVGKEPVYEVVAEDASPFSFDRHYAMSNAHAGRLGFTFSHTADWLPQTIAEALAAA